MIIGGKIWKYALYYWFHKTYLWDNIWDVGLNDREGEDWDLQERKSPMSKFNLVFIYENLVVRWAKHNILLHCLGHSLNSMYDFKICDFSFVVYIHIFYFVYF